MPTYPFQRAKPIGFSLFEQFTSAQASVIDQNAAQAADGLVWTDVAQYRNWSAPVTVDGTATPGLAFVYSPYEQAWWTFGFSSGPVPVAWKLRGGSGSLWIGTGGILAGSGNLTPARNGADYDSINNVMMMAGTPTTTTTKKFRRFNPVTQAWTAPDSSQNTTGGVTCIKWVSQLGLWSAGHTTGAIETSPDGTTWTNRATAGNTDSRWSIALAVPSANVVVAATTNGNKVLQSTDGITWNVRTLPSSNNWQNVVYVPLRGEFVVFDRALANVAYSTDGITWTARARTLPGGFTATVDANANAIAFGRNIVTTLFDNTGAGQNVIVYSQDGGATWKTAASFSPTLKGPVGGNSAQLWYTTDTNQVVSCLSGGF